jgi:aryl-alcohol dehydrogenase-like predicted oxidoreductase
MTQYLRLGASALQVSRLTLGTMTFGAATDEATALRIVDRARDAGVNSIDTADVYADGRSEEIVGRAIRSDRDRWVLATKFVNSREPGPNLGGQSRKWVIRAVEASLRRLGTDYVDVLYFHKAVFDQPLEEPLRAIADLIRAGKLRYFGVSNFRGWRIAEIARLADDLGIDRPVASQPLYNLVTRTAEVEQLPAAARFGIGVISYSPLARGVLTGKYAPGAAPDPDSRAGRGDKRIAETEWRPESLEIAQKVAAHARTRGLSAAEFAFAWVLNNRLVQSAIAGPRTEAQWESYARALAARLSAEDEAFVDGLVAPGHASSPVFLDPSHPVEGRVPRDVRSEPTDAPARRVA